MSELDLHIKNYVAEIRARLGDEEPTGELRYILENADRYLAGQGLTNTGRVYDMLYSIIEQFDAQDEANEAAVAREQAWLESPAAAEMRKEIAAEDAELAAKHVEIGGGAAAELFEGE